jgi:hypothetical protein
VIEDVVDGAEHQHRHDGEQIAVLQRPEERAEEFSDFQPVGVMPVARGHRGREQHQEPADERADQAEDQIAFHGDLCCWLNLKSGERRVKGTAMSR